MLTVIDSRRTDAPLLLPDGSEFALSGEDRPLTSVRWLYTESFGGYVFPSDMKLYARRFAASVPFTQIVADHGVNPESEAYAYILLPRFSWEMTAAFAEEPPVQVLSNSASVQAVCHKDGRQMYVFWQKGSLGGISVSDPLMLMIVGNRLYVSDPTQKLREASVTVNGREYRFDLHDSHGATLSADL